MKNLVYSINKRVLKKENGISEFFTSMFAIAAIVVVAFIMVYLTGDVTSKLDIDQVARSYSLKLESKGRLTVNDYNTLIEDLNGVTDKCKSATLYVYSPDVDYYNTTNVNGYKGRNIKDIAANSNVAPYIGYGNSFTITLVTEMYTTRFLGVDWHGRVTKETSKGANNPANTTKESLNTGNQIGSGVTTYTVIKSSTSKY